MQITIHRGTHEIGGTCIEVQSGDSRIIIDLGLPLMGRDGLPLDGETVKNPSVSNGILPPVEGLYAGDRPSVSAVVLSHAHTDHYGLINHVHPDVPIHMSGETKALIEVADIFRGPAQADMSRSGNCPSFGHWEPFRIGPFLITSYLMDHSAFGSSALLIEADGQKVLYTGDLRRHGRKGRLFDRLIENPIVDIDCLIMEGTTLGRGLGASYPTEEDVENGMYQVFSSQKDTSFVMASGSNIDRLVSIYKASMRAGKVLVIDLYQFHLLKRLKAFSPGLPPHPDDHVRIRYMARHAGAIAGKVGKEVLYEYTSRRIRPKEILERRGNMVLRIPFDSMSQAASMLARDKPLQHANFIFSMWDGYLERDPLFDRFVHRHGMQMHEIHSGGHATLSDLRELAQALKPGMIVPVHTLAGDEFARYFARVLRIDDGIPFEARKPGLTQVAKWRE